MLPKREIPYQRRFCSFPSIRNSPNIDNVYIPYRIFDAERQLHLSVQLASIAAPYTYFPLLFFFFPPLRFLFSFFFFRIKRKSNVVILLYGVFVLYQFVFVIWEFSLRYTIHNVRRPHRFRKLVPFISHENAVPGFVHVRVHPRNHFDCVLLTMICGGYFIDCDF